ncbi:MAG: hypothetical protein ACPF8V_09645 [Luteibaculum sp.]
MRIFLFAIVLGSLLFTACEPKEPGENFPVTFDNLKVNISTVTQLDTTVLTDSSSAEITVLTSDVSNIVERFFDANGNQVAETTSNFTYNTVQEFAGVNISGSVETALEVRYENGERIVKHNFKNDLGFEWDDSTIAYTLPMPISKTDQPTSAKVNYYWIDGSRKIAYRMQDNISYQYAGANLIEIDIKFVGATDSIFVSSLTPDQTNYDTNQTVIFAKDTIPMPKVHYTFSSTGRANTLQSYYPLFYLGYDSYILTGSTYPRQVLKEYFQGEQVVATEIFEYVYVNDPVTGELQTVKEHRTNGGPINQGNLRRSWFISKQEF